MRRRTCNLCIHRDPAMNLCRVRAAVMLPAAPACGAFRNRNQREYMRRYMAGRKAEKISQNAKNTNTNTNTQKGNDK